MLHFGGFMGEKWKFEHSYLLCRNCAVVWRKIAFLSPAQLFTSRRRCKASVDRNNATGDHSSEARMLGL